MNSISKWVKQTPPLDCIDMVVWVRYTVQRQASASVGLILAPTATAFIKPLKPQIHNAADKWVYMWAYMRQANQIYFYLLLYTIIKAYGPLLEARLSSNYTVACCQRLCWGRKPHLHTVKHTNRLSPFGNNKDICNQILQCPRQQENTKTTDSVVVWNMEKSDNPLVQPNTIWSIETYSLQHIWFYHFIKTS